MQSLDLSAGFLGFAKLFFCVAKLAGELLSFCSVYMYNDRSRDQKVFETVH